MDIFTNGLVILTICCALLHFYTRTKATVLKDNVSFSRFQRLYLTVYLMAMFADWLQGPHVYALYQSYNMTKHQIEILFITGFGSSLVFGTLVGSFADKCGRRFNCILYGVLYSMGSLTKHFNNFHILMFGRLLAGISTSILYTAFESWLIYEHKNRGFDEQTLGIIFTNAYFGNSVVAILAGIVAQVVSNSFGYVAPFDTSFLVLVCMTLFIVLHWSENHGDASAHLKQSFATAWRAIQTDSKVLFLGLVQSLFEGSMYMFVLEWTPALTAGPDTSKAPIPHGYIFATYMVAVMIGSNLFRILVKHQTCDQFMRPVLLVSATSLAIPFLLPGNQLLIFVAFIAFEICVGIFWPAMGTLRSALVPEIARSTIMNFFRIPLNAIVVIILLQDLQLIVIFKFCFLLLVLSSLCMIHLRNLMVIDQLSKQTSTGHQI